MNIELGQQLIAERIEKIHRAINAKRQKAFWIWLTMIVPLIGLLTAYALLDPKILKFPMVVLVAVVPVLIMIGLGQKIPGYREDYHTISHLENVRLFFVLADKENLSTELVLNSMFRVITEPRDSDFIHSISDVRREMVHYKNQSDDADVDASHTLEGEKDSS